VVAELIERSTSAFVASAGGLTQTDPRGWVIGQRFQRRWSPIRREIFEFSRVVDPGTERAGARHALEQKQRVAHVIAELARVYFLLADFCNVPMSLVDETPVTIVVSGPSNPAHTLLGTAETGRDRHSASLRA
jgi:hypothetical protein